MSLRESELGWAVLKFVRKRLRRLARRIWPPPRCIICGSKKFKAGPYDRLGANGKLPKCVRCRSMERHRAFHKIFLRIGIGEFKAWRCLQFSKDPTVIARWFAHFERSLYGESNSLDLQAIDRPDASYDLIVCNHVLEHVPDYRTALRELARVLNARGFLLLSFPNPHRLEKTVDWGFPKPEEFGHYRNFGRDIEPVIAEHMPGCHVLPVIERDDITGDADIAYVVTRNRQWLDRLQR
jgi:SAM-dependent methyltransferase